MKIAKEEVHYYINPKTGLEDPNFGMILDHKKIRANYRKVLKSAQKLYDPTTIPYEKIRYAVLMSTRKTGKTNTNLLYWFVAWQMYGCTGAYIRQVESQITYNDLKTFYDVLRNFNYASIVTDGEYSDFEIRGSYAYLVQYDEKLKVNKRSDPFMWFGAISAQEKYKSKLNLIKCQWIMYDEFISKINASVDEFGDYLQLLSTIIRDKVDVKILMLANSQDIYNSYLYNLMIQDEVQRLKQNDSALIVTPKGTCLYVELIGDRSLERERLNMLYFGFDHASVNAVTGGDWTVSEYPRIIREDRQIITKSIYLLYNNQIIQFEIAYNERLRTHVLVHRAEKISEKALTIFTISDIVDFRYQFAFGAGDICRRIWKMYDDRKFFYSDNTLGYTVEKYVSMAAKL